MYSDSMAELCLRCGARGMPPTIAGSVATARRCQLCGYIQELDPSTGLPVPDAFAQLRGGE